MDNSTDQSNDTAEVRCNANYEIPSAKQVIQEQSGLAIAAIVVAVLLCAATLALFTEHIIFVQRTFKKEGRKAKTTIVLALYPVYSVSALVGFMVPRASTLVDLVANIYLGVTMVYFLHLLLDYFGGVDAAKARMKGADVSLRTLPCCCLFFCLPTLTFNKKVYMRLHLLVLQVAIIRPLLMFIAAVLWADGNYTPGLISAQNAYIFITVINLASSLWAVYGLMVLKNTFTEALAQFSIAGKFLCLQLLIILTVLLNIILNILVMKNVIRCDDLFSSKSRGDRIYHLAMVCLMVPLSVFARYNYHKTSDGNDVVGLPDEQNGRNHSNGRSSVYSNGEGVYNNKNVVTIEPQTSEPNDNMSHGHGYDSIDSRRYEDNPAFDKF